MPRGRHRHSPPLHRLLPPSVIAGVSVVCAVGPWLFTEPLVLRGLAAGAAATTAVGSVVMRRWDLAAGKRVADLTRARASDEWRHEERVAELETDLDESRELRTKLEQKLRAKRTELANLRNEHASLLRRYATAETERASALEGRRLLAIETTSPAKALPAAEPKPPAEQETPDEAEDLVAAGAGDAAAVDAEPSAAVAEDAEPSAARVFSPEGSSLFMRADSALVRLIKGKAEAQEESGASEPDASGSDAEEDETQAAGTDPAGDDEAQADGAAQDGEAAEPAVVTGDAQPGRTPESAPRSAGRKATAKASPPEDGPGNGGGRKPNAAPEAPASAAKEGGSAEAVEAEGKPAAVAGPEHAAAPTAQQPQPARPPHASGHFTVPTAVAVVPAAPRRRPAVEGGFDFFGTQKSRESLESVQNEDLADVVGQEALAMHKAESESGFKAMDPQARGIGQVIDLTAHDETEQIDVQGLRTAAS
ncbi:MULTISPECIES: hypothetical protein [unclassified Streptomyces]|uniref:hypothetical protein n=1 Tax=unclassified Streptomyces TaxID=2593676 RepID=UPI003D8D9362